MEEKVQGKPVQEILIDNNDEIPERYVYKNGYPQCKKESVPYMDEFFIDFSLVTSSSPQGNQELEKLLLALNQWGCFQAVNHGMAEEYLNKIRQLGRQFFALPLEEKQKYSREIGGFDGYGTDAFFSDQQSLGNDTVSSDQKITLDWLDRLYLTVYPEHKRKFKFWPEMPLEFREILHEYTLKVKEVRDQLLKAVARSLELEENRFLKEQGDFVKMSARFNLYPPCSTPENVLGFKPHSDIGTLTVILQDNEVEGLQVLKVEKWFKVPTYPDALFINVGDSLEIMSNGVLKSPVHRVVTNSEKERISIAIFSDLEKEFGPIDELITEERPRMYKRVEQYDDKIFFEKYQRGMRMIDVVRL